jgi:SAM-dependent methyltransferase
MASESPYRLKSAATAELLRRCLRRLLPYRLRCQATERGAFLNKTGIEFGGPSPVFSGRGFFPVYRLAARVDNCNFDHQTLWEGKIHPQNGFRFDTQRAPGRQFIAEASDVGFIPENTYDFVLSSHMLEHSANPVRVLREWLRILRPGGTLFLVLPHREGTFDHLRPVTPLDHLLKDFERQTGEDDLTHLPEILALHDLSRDPGAMSFAEFKTRSERNRENRGLHHHVFDMQLAIELLDHLRLQIRTVEGAYPYHIALLATRLAAGFQPDNAPFLRDEATCRLRSPFRSDRRRQYNTQR